MTSFYNQATIYGIPHYIETRSVRGGHVKNIVTFNTCKIQLISILRNQTNFFPNLPLSTQNYRILESSAQMEFFSMSLI